MRGKYTPGPWRVARLGDGSDQYRIGNIIGPDDLPICTFVGRIAYQRRGAEQAEADARLIAAAPDLLAALESAPWPRAYASPDNEPVAERVYRHWFNKVRAAALAKVRAAGPRS